MKTLMLIMTSGLQYDDRLRKETLSLSELGASVEIVALEQANLATRRDVYGGITARTIHLRTRTLFAQKAGLVFKMLEMYILFMRYVFTLKPSAVWIHNLELGGLIPLLWILRMSGYVKFIVWDQHELPPDSFLSNQFLMRVFQMLMNATDQIIMANEERRDLIRQSVSSGFNVPIAILNNYPDKGFIQNVKRNIPLDVHEWLDGQQYILAQGGANPDRHFDQLVTAISRIDQIKLVVVGPYQDLQRANLQSGPYNSDIEDRVLLTGSVPQMDLIPFIDNAIASIILYEMSNANTRLCAPNRLYQAVSRGVPVVVGSNPPMARFVSRYECGIILAGDGHSANDIEQGLRKMIYQHGQFRQQAQLHCNAVTWESQLPTIANLVDSIALRTT